MTLCYHTLNDYPLDCSYEHHWIPSQLSGALVIRGVEASSVKADIFPTLRYNGRRNLTVHVSCRGHLIPSFTLRDGCITKLPFLDTRQPTATSTSVSSSPSASFCTTPTPFTTQLSFNATAAAAIVPFLASHLSISVGVAQHGLVVGGLEQQVCLAEFLFSGRCVGFDSVRGVKLWIWGNVR